MKTGSGSNNNIGTIPGVTNNNLSLVPPLAQARSSSAHAASHIVTEWEDGIIFDVDDPDFCNLAADKLNFIVPSTAANMSIASVHGPQIADICSPLSHHNLGLSASLPDLVGSPLEISMDNVLTIEELRQHMGSCFTCGVSWTDDHVSLDCSECGGYSLERPCPLCDGQCGVQWKRDFAMSHACSQARWVGVCISYPEVVAGVQLPVGGAVGGTSCAAAAANQLRLAQELCSRLEQLSTSTASKSGRI
ncbi:hypothetical protein KR009_002804 [Drosophila setifemur]|nr:hypothetical protein KR009_002804 [Drosophila setifemur]